MPRRRASKDQLEEYVNRVLDAASGGYAYSRSQVVRNTTNVVYVKTTLTPDELAAITPFYDNDSGISLFDGRANFIRESINITGAALHTLLDKTPEMVMMRVRYKRAQEEARERAIEDLRQTLLQIELELGRAESRAREISLLDQLLEYINGLDDYPSLKNKAEKLYAENGGGWIR